jgi:hypothetical protein
MYARLLNLYPASYRALFAVEMSAVFAQRLSEPRSAGSHGRARLIVTEFVALFRDLARAWISRIAHAVSHDTNCGCIPDFRKMRPPWTEAKSYYRLFRSPRK